MSSNEFSTPGRATQLALLAASALTVMAGATIAPALPELYAHFQGVPHGEILTKLVLTLPALFIALLAPFAGAAVDRWGRKGILIASTVLYGLAGASGYLIDWLPGILIGRALLGVAVAGVMTAASTLIADYFHGEARSRFMGLQNGFVGFGGLSMMLLGGVLAGVGWRMPFLIYLIALVFVPIFMLVIREPERPMPPTGEALARQADQRPVPLIYAIAGVTMLAFYMVPVQLPFYLKAVFHTSPALGGLAIGSSTLLFALVSPQFHRVRARLSLVAVMTLAFTSMALGLEVVAMAVAYWQVLGGMMLLGLGTGLLMPNMSVWLMEIAPAHLRGRLMGGLTASLFLGQFLSPIVTQPMTALVGLGGTFGVVGGFLGALAVVTAGTGVRMKRAASAA